VQGRRSGEIIAGITEEDEEEEEEEEVEEVDDFSPTLKPGEFIEEEEEEEGDRPGKGLLSVPMGVEKGLPAGYTLQPIPFMSVVEEG
jgi:hypothetical protein